VEGSSADRFAVTGLRGCALGPADVTIELSESSAGLIFDVTVNGAGVQAYRSYGTGTCAHALGGEGEIQDGDTDITLTLRDITLGVSVSFTIDLDDTAGARESIVSDPEIAGASVRVSNGQGPYKARFSENAVARVMVDGCMS
jgi:hypothetical protein